ncbi:uncharacterized protein LOC141905899 [Tubulanus polymorphus]|uniref:uncharacterized protein LOC141905899 n=1 Tax=Tubulanus polymorphus TaxID=672921 RepID=UPI003DA5837E
MTVDRIRLLWIFVVLSSCLVSWSGRGGLCFKYEDQLDDYIEHIRRCRKIPAVSVAVVQDEDIWTKAYGESDRETGKRATTKSLFCIASLTKAFTSTLLAMVLSEQEGLSWDTPLKQILGDGFALNDHLRTEHTNLRDVLSHRVGSLSYFLPLMTGFPRDVTRNELIRRLRFMESPAPFRTQFIYSNYMYTLAGHVAEELKHGQTWESLVTEYLFKPLNMDTATFVPMLTDVDDLAKPYVTKNGSLTRIHINTARVVVPLGPAGSIVASTDDMAKWLRFHVTGGKSSSDNQLVKPEMLTDTYTGQVATPFPGSDKTLPTWPIADMSISYNLAWMTSAYRGYKILWHSGEISGYSSKILFIPELKIGIYANINGAKGPADSVKIIAYVLADLLIGLPVWLNKTTVCSYPQPWVRNTPKTKTEMKPARIVKKNVSHKLEEYTGEYGNLAFGNITVSLDVEKSTLYFAFGRYGRAQLVPVDTRDQFAIKWTGVLSYLHDSDVQLPPNIVRFYANPTNENRISRLSINLDPSISTNFSKGLKLTDTPKTKYYDGESAAACMLSESVILTPSTFQRGFVLVAIVINSVIFY